MNESPLWIETVQVQDGSNRQINLRSTMAQLVQDRKADVQAAISQVSQLLQESVAGIEPQGDWEVDKVEATVGVSLSAETGAVIAKASSTGTINLKITYKRSGA